MFATELLMESNRDEVGMRLKMCWKQDEQLKQSKCATEEFSMFCVSTLCVLQAWDLIMSALCFI